MKTGIPIAEVNSLVLFIISGAAFLLTVINLALKGLGAPFAIALSKKVATGWMYAWTRNPKGAIREPQANYLRAQASPY